VQLPFPPLPSHFPSSSTLVALGGNLIAKPNQGLKSLPMLQAAVRVALYAQDSRERSAALDLLAGFCRNNPEGQAVLASTIAPLGDHPPISQDATDTASTFPCCETFGTEIVAAFTLSFSSTRFIALIFQLSQFLLN
jgi:hypothetical protein